MQSGAVFNNRWLPYALLAPQIFITGVFFFWPAFEAVKQSLFMSDPFGLSTQYVGFDNFEYLFKDSYYRASFFTTAIFSTLVTISSLSVALLLAVLVDRVIKGSGAYRSILIWPYAIAPAIAGVLWLFMFNPSIGVASYYLKQLGYEWNHVLNGGEAMFLVVVASAW